MQYQTTDQAMDVQCRMANTDDIPLIVDLVESAYRGERSRRGWTTEAEIIDGRRTDQAMVADILQQPQNRIVLAESQDQLLACVHISERGERAYIGMFAVKPQSQGQGIGRALLGYAESCIEQLWSAVSIEMTVIAQRPELIAWYERRGYQKSGELREFPYGDERYGKPRRDDLVLEVLLKSLK